MALFKKAAAVVKEAENKQDTKIILVVGAEHSIFPFHLAHSLKNRGGDVLLIDNSISQDLFSAVPKDGEIGNAYEISVVSKRAVTMPTFKKFDFVIVYLGYTPDESYYDVADGIILLSDYTLVSRDYMAEFDAHNIPFQVVFFNKVTGRVSEKMLLDVMTKSPVKAGSEIHSLEFTEEDASGYIHLLYDGFYAISKMSKDYQSTLSALTNFVIAPVAEQVGIEEDL